MIPAWLKRTLPTGKDFFATKAILEKHRLNTICQDAKCPNVWECWSLKTATFMILGDVCTRACGFCSVGKGRPGTLDAQEPLRIAQAVREMGLRFVVLTSVDRDDLEDQGAGHFRDTVLAIRSLNPGARVETLTPDFRGDADCLKLLFDFAKPDVYAHNIETVPRLYTTARRGSSYTRSLGVLRAAKELGGDMPVKSGIMVGLGEKQEEVLETLSDLRNHGVDIVTIGQYLKPSQKNLDVVEYHVSDYFEFLGQRARAMGFAAVHSGPLVRSSYHADELAGHTGART